MSTTWLSDPAPPPTPPPISAQMLFCAFARIALSGFGSVLFWTHRELVERQRWLSAHEYVDLLALGQLLPGATGLNLTVMVGYRLAGWTGAAAAVAGFMGGPCLIAIALGVLYQRYDALPLVHQTITGMAAVAAGLFLASAVKIATVLPRQWRPWLVAGLAFLGVGVVRWPLLGVVGILAPCAILAAWKSEDV